jgi:hypothetical protein
MIAYQTAEVATKVATELRDKNGLPKGMLSVLDYKGGACFLVGVSAEGALNTKALVVLAAHYHRSIDDIINAELHILCGQEFRPRPEGKKAGKSKAVIV